MGSKERERDFGHTTRFYGNCGDGRKMGGWQASQNASSGPGFASAKSFAKGTGANERTDT